MIDLTPIDEKIQKRLFQKMDLLGNKAPNKSSGGLTPQKLTNKTTFIRMTSGLENPVILMGGELTYGTTDSDGFGVAGSQRLTAGYDDIYGPRVVQKPDDYDFFDDNTNTENKFKRPIPGIKSIDVNFKGGVRALREATISWTCWSFEDINRLSPHFLAHGKTIVLEWGWVYDKTTLRNLPSLIGKDGVKKSAYNNYKKEVLKSNGDFDFMVGIVKNFEYTTREDGAFDCQTIITSVGNSIISNTTPNQVSENTSVTSKLTKQKELDDLKKVIKKEDEDIISFDVGVSLKTMISFIEGYIRSITTTSTPKESVRDDDGENFTIAYEPDRFVSVSRIDGGVQSDVWVRWGWFEDNILSKFLTLVSDSSERPYVTQFRSVEKTELTIKDEFGKEITRDGFESTRVRTHKRLETVNVNKYILPGKFKTFDLANKEERVGVGIIKIGRTIDRGDRELHHKLSKIINDNFSSFDHPSGKYGRMRNFLINTKILKEAFSVGNNQVTTESLNLKESLENLFRLLNEDIPFWSLQTTQDNEDDFRTKIIDTSQTAVEFEGKKKINRTKNKDIGTKSSYNPDIDEVTNNGVFFFPVWRTDSIVKSQNIVTKIPDALAISTMYGANYDSVKFLEKPPVEASSVEATALAGMYSQSEDKNLKNIDIALRKDRYKTIGQTDDSKDIEINGGTDNVFDYLKRVSSNIKEKYEEKIKKINTQLNNTKKENINKEIAEAEQAVQKVQLEFENKPFPTPDSLRDTEPTRFQVLLNLGFFQDVYDRKFYDDGRMKQSFIDYISNSVSITPDKKSAETAKPLLIPMDMELEIEGIGGIVPGNSYHSTYLPSRYQEETMFQIFDVGHKVDSSGWSVTLAGVMRSSFSKLTQSNKTVAISKITDEIFKLVDDKSKAEADLEDIQTKETTKAVDKIKKITKVGTTGGFLG